MGSAITKPLRNVYKEAATSGNFSKRIHKSKNQPQVAWNVSAGMGFRIGDVGKLDVKYQYISLGKVSKRGKDSDLVLGAAKLAKSLPINGHVVTVGFRRDL